MPSWLCQIVNAATQDVLLDSIRTPMVKKRKQAFIHYLYRIQPPQIRSMTASHGGAPLTHMPVRFLINFCFNLANISEGPYLRGSHPFRRGGVQHRGIRKPCNQGVGALSSIPLKS
jgi:hypothetical protein